MQTTGKQTAWAPLLALAAGAGILLAAAMLRGAEYDENYTLLLAAGTPRPAWPEGVFMAGEAQAVFAGHASLASIARDLRATDVHPPLYFWAVAAWRWLAGPSLFGVRLLSVLCSVVGLGMVGAIARLARVPPARAMLLTVFCYGFAYTGAIARGFALAQALSLAGVWLALLAAGAVSHPSLGSLARGGSGFGRADPHFAFVAGLCLGAATLSNYLAVFVAGATLLWLLAWPRAWVAATMGFGFWLQADLWFYLAQRDSRPGQFPPFSLIGSLPRLAQYAAANLFGGLPLYVDGLMRALAAAALATFAVLLVALVVLHWRRIGAAPARHLFTLAALAPPLGLLSLGLVFGQTPIELRYLAFATPFAALLLAGMLSSLPSRWRLGVLAAILAVQGGALLGMVTRQETMQPARATAAAAASLAQGGVVLLPRGNDGVGVVGAFVNEAPPSLLLSIAEATDSATTLRARAGDAHRVVLALIGVDAASRATVTAMRAAFAGSACWREAGSGVNVLGYDRVCQGDEDIPGRLHADEISPRPAPPGTGRYLRSAGPAPSAAHAPGRDDASGG